MPKGEKIKAKAIKGISYHLRNFENSKIELFVLSKYSYWIFVSKIGLLRGEGEFLKSLINFSWNDSLYVLTCVFDLEIEI